MPLTLDRILFPTDFSASAEGAYRHAAWLADRFGAELHVLHVVEDPAAPERPWPDAPEADHGRISLADVCQDLGLPGPPPAGDGDPDAPVDVVRTEVAGRKPPEAILDYARDEGVGLIVMGTSGRRGWRRGALGSVAEAVTRRATCPVLTVRPLGAPGQGEWPPRRMLLAVDDVADGDVPTAAQWAARLAVAYGAPLDVVHVTPPTLALSGPLISAGDRVRAREALLALVERLRSEVPGELPVSLVVRTGAAADKIRAVAGDVRTHLLVVGTSGRGGLGRAVLGSVAEDLVRTAPCPVLVARDVLAAPASGAAGPPEPS